MKTISNTKWEKICRNFEYSDADYTFTHNNTDYTLDQTYSGKTLLFQEGALIAYSEDGPDALRRYID